MTAPPGSGTGPRLATPAFVVLAAATLAFFVAGGLILPIAPRFAKVALEADALGFGLSIGSFSIASLVLRPVVGWSADRFGRRPLLIGGSILHGVVTFIIGMSGGDEATWYVAGASPAFIATMPVVVCQDNHWGNEQEHAMIAALLWGMVHVVLSVVLVVAAVRRLELRNVE